MRSRAISLAALGACSTPAQGPDARPADMRQVFQDDVYFTVSGLSGSSNGAVLMVPKAGGTATYLSTWDNYPMGIAVSTAGVFWVNNRDGTVMKL